MWPLLPMTLSVCLWKRGAKMQKGKREVRAVFFHWPEVTSPAKPWPHTIIYTFTEGLGNCCCLAPRSVHTEPTSTSSNLCSSDIQQRTQTLSDVKQRHLYPPYFIWFCTGVMAAATFSDHACIPWMHAYVHVCVLSLQAGCGTWWNRINPQRGPIKPCWWQPGRPPGARKPAQAGTRSCKLLSLCQPPHATPRHSRPWC